MPTEMSVEALLVDKELADQVWEAWDKGEIDDQCAAIAWLLIAIYWLAPPQIPESVTAGSLPNIR